LQEASSPLDTLLNVLDPLSTITDLLGLSATPAVQYVPAGDLGLYTAVANQPARALTTLYLQVCSVRGPITACTLLLSLLFPGLLATLSSLHKVAG